MNAMTSALTTCNARNQLGPLFAKRNCNSTRIGSESETENPALTQPADECCDEHEYGEKRENGHVLAMRAEVVGELLVTDDTVIGRVLNLERAETREEKLHDNGDEEEGEKLPMGCPCVRHRATL